MALAGRLSGGRVLRSAVALLAAAVGAAACGGGEAPAPDRGGSDQVALDGRQTTPPRGCFDSAVGSLALRETAALEAEGALATDGEDAGDRGWIPGRVTDLAVTDGGLYVLDEQTREVHWVSADLESRRLLASHGPGPGELSRPVALAAGPRLVWVLDRRKGRVLGFDRSGEVRVRHDLPRRADEMAVDGRGRFYLATRVPRPDLRLPDLSEAETRELFRRLGRTGFLVTFDPATGATDSVALTRWRGPPARPFVEPFWTEVELRGLDRGVAVLYRTANWVDVYRGGDLGERPVSLEGCWSERQEAYYRQARAEADDAGRPTQSTLPLLSDVIRPPGGGYLVLSPTPAADGRYHLDRYGEDGRYLGSHVGPRELVIPGLSRLSADGRRIYGALGDGTLARLRVDLGRDP